MAASSRRVELESKRGSRSGLSLVPTVLPEGEGGPRKGLGVRNGCVASNSDPLGNERHSAGNFGCRRRTPPVEELKGGPPKGTVPSECQHGSEERVTPWESRRRSRGLWDPWEGAKAFLGNSVRSYFRYVRGL